MAAFNPFQDMFMQINQMVSHLLNNRDKLVKTGELPEGARDQLKIIGLKVDALLESLQLALNEWGNPEIPPPNEIDLNKLPPKSANAIKEAEKFKKILTELQREVKKQLSLLELRKKTYGKKGDAKKFGETRKKRLQRLGGDGKNWIPL